MEASSCWLNDDVTWRMKRFKHRIIITMITCHFISTNTLRHMVRGHDNCPTILSILLYSWFLRWWWREGTFKCKLTKWRQRRIISTDLQQRKRVTNNRGRYSKCAATCLGCVTGELCGKEFRHSWRGTREGGSYAIERLIAPIKTSNWQFLD